MAREIVYSEDGIINARVKQKVDTLSNWESNDMIILDGEQAFVRTADGVPVNFKIGEGDKPFADLPWWLDSGSPFKLRLSDTDFVEVTGGNTIVTHPGLVGFDDYPVMTTQLNVIFRDDDLTYNSTDGTITISDFELQSGEFLILYPPSMKWAATTGSGSAFAALVARVDELERKSAPFEVDELTGESPARVWWTRPINEIPTGWTIDDDWNGRVPVGYNSSDSDFNAIGKTGGSKTHSLSINELPQFVVDIEIPRRSASGNDGSNSLLSSTPTGVGDVTYQSDPIGNNVPHNNLQPYKVGCWIKYVGV